MTTMPALPSYTEVTIALKNTPAHYNAAQVHGVLCGLICATSGKSDTRWEKALLGNTPDQEAKELLLELYETSYHQMSEFSFEFTLLLPLDDVDINVRAEALGLWCQGFLTGLEIGKIPIENREPGEITEAITDILEISQVNFGDIATNEEDETAYFELVEYVRLAALMIYHELKSTNLPAQTNLLH